MQIKEELTNVPHTQKVGKTRMTGYWVEEMKNTE